MRVQIVALIVCGVLVACGGSMGPAGPAGPAGATGATGAGGASGLTITGTKSCRGQAVVGINLLFQYQVVSYSNGDKMVSCSVTDGHGAYSSSNYWRSSQT